MVIALALKISNTTYLLKTLIVCLIALTILGIHAEGDERERILERT